MKPKSTWRTGKQPNKGKGSNKENKSKIERLDRKKNLKRSY